MKRFWVNITNLHGIYGVEEGKTPDQAYFSARGRRLKKKYQKDRKKYQKRLKKKSTKIPQNLYLTIPPFSFGHFVSSRHIHLLWPILRLIKTIPFFKVPFFVFCCFLLFFLSLLAIVLKIDKSVIKSLYKLPYGLYILLCLVLVRNYTNHS